MTKSLCPPLRSSIVPFNLGSRRSNPSAPQPQERESNLSREDYILGGSSQSMFSDNYFELGSASVDPANVPSSIPLWPDHGLASDASRLPRHINRYGTLNDVSRERTSIWSGDPRPGAARQAYLPMPADSYPFGSLDHAEDRNGQWGTPDYSSYFTDYPTPQSDISGPSPPPALNDMTPFSLYNSGTGMMYVPDTTSNMQQDSRGFMHAGGSCPRLPQIPEMPSRDECRSPHRQGQRDWYPIEGNESDGDDSISSEPYAQLIARALRSAPEHKMVLKEIYRWFEKNTNKAKGNSKGWQNSIRHNLSMNGVSICVAKPSILRDVDCI